MMTGVTARKIFLSLSIIAIISSTTFIFHKTQSRYKVLIRARKCLDEKRYYEAVPFLVSAFKMNHADAETGLKLLWDYEHLGMKKEMRQLIYELQDNLPNDIKIKEEFADACSNMSDYSRAEKFYKEVLGRKRDLRVLMKYAEVLAWQKKYKETFPLFDEIIVKSNRNPDVIEFLADIAAWAKDYNKASAMYKGLLETGCRSKKAVTLKLADALRFAGKNEEAIELYNKYMKEEK